jgi:hypothetical protein
LSYPLSLTVAPDDGQNRLWGIPLLGAIVRWVMVIPHYIILLVLALVMYVVVLVSWIPVLVNGRQAGWITTVVEAYLRIYARTGMYVGLITGKYPPIGLAGEHSVMLSIAPEPQNRLWGIPFFGVFVRWILLIPHIIVLAILAIAFAFVILFSWVPVLVNGRQAQGIVDFSAGFVRWSSRVSAYGMLVTGTYPPFSLSD